MQVRGGYTGMAVHALNGLVGAVDNVGGTLASNKEYTIQFPEPDPFMDDIAKEGKKYEKIDHLKPETLILPDDVLVAGRKWM